MHAYMVYSKEEDAESQTLHVTYILPEFVNKSKRFSLEIFLSTQLVLLILTHDSVYFWFNF